jgi:hypothetical protein
MPAAAAKMMVGSRTFMRRNCTHASRNQLSEGAQGGEGRNHATTHTAQPIRQLTRDTGLRGFGVVLILVTGLLNFHVPHFFLESSTTFDAASRVLELVYVANLAGAVVAAVGIARNTRWGWIAGLALVALSFLLYVAQETLGLPGLPKDWLERSRIVAVLVEVTYAITAWRRLRRIG